MSSDLLICTHFILFEAFECYLCGIRPVYGEWSHEANARFHEMVQGQNFVGKVSPIESFIFIF